MDVSKYQTFIEGSITLVYKKMSLENKVDRLNKLVMKNQPLEDINFPYPHEISNLFSSLIAQLLFKFWA